MGAGVQKGYLEVSKHSPFLRWADEPGAGAWAQGAWWGAEHGRPREVGLGNARSWGLDPSPGRGLRGWLEGPLAQLHFQKMSDPQVPGLPSTGLPQIPTLAGGAVVSSWQGAY